ncbi:MAG: NAD(P)H-hydrate epimerase, partial [Pseudomonadota bacterium]
MQLLTAEEVRRIEREGMARRGMTGLELMERAGFNAAEKMLLWRPELQEGRRRMIVLCGPGGNGGDGFVSARLLAARGWQVDLFWLGDPERQPPDAAATRARWESVGETRPFAEAGPALEAAFQPDGDVDVILDALFGIGMSRPMSPEAEAVLAPILAASPRRPGPPVVSVDMPSGVCSDSGRLIGAAVRADLTLTFIGPKPGQFLLPGAALSEEVRVIRLLGGRWREAAAAVPHVRLGRAAPAGLIKGAADPYGHKYDHGHVLVAAGGVGRGGAARLAARGALRVGAGAVTVAAPPPAQ